MASESRLVRARNFLLSLADWINGLQGKDKRHFVLLVTLIGAMLYFYGARMHLHHINHKETWVDQDAYVNYAVKLRETDWRYAGDFNRMPVYPHLMAVYYNDSVTTLWYYTTAKYMNIVLSFLLLTGLFLIYLHYFPNLTAFNLFLLTGFLMYIFKAAYIQVELLFYFLSFISYLLLVRMLVLPVWWLAVLTGLMLGLTHLAKASVMPAIVLFVLFFLLKLIWQRPAWKIVFYRVACLVLVLAFYLAAIYPYIQTANRMFGHYFYNVNSTFYIWYDSWEEAKAGVRQHNDYTEYPDLPAEKIPDWRQYISEKSPGEIISRFTSGFIESLRRHTYSGGYGYFWYLAAFSLITGWLLYNRTALWRDLWQQYRFAILFVLAYFVAYLALYSFYVPIHPGQRFMLMLYIPAIFSFMWVAARFEDQNRWFTLFNMILCGILVTHALANVFYGVTIIRAGG